MSHVARILGTILLILKSGCLASCYHTVARAAQGCAPTITTTKHCWRSWRGADNSPWANSGSVTLDIITSVLWASVSSSLKWSSWFQDSQISYISNMSDWQRGIVLGLWVGTAVSSRHVSCFEERKYSWNWQRSSPFFPPWLWPLSSYQGLLPPWAPSRKWSVGQCQEKLLPC